LNQDDRDWTLVRSFYLSLRSFRALFEQYEQRVLQFAVRYGVDRKQLKLPPDELHSLIDPQALEALLREELEPLRDIVQLVFGGAYVPDPFSSQVMNIYHEVAILKEEHRTIGDPTMKLDHSEYDRYYREVNVYYPRRLKHVRNLYGKARKRLEGLLPPMGRNKVLSRSLYLFGDRLLRGVYERGLEEAYEHVYPNGGALTGYTLVADSFYKGAFWERGEEAYKRALDVLEQRAGALPDVGAKPARARTALAAKRGHLVKRVAMCAERAAGAATAS
jgi:hypothetical protein